MKAWQEIQDASYGMVASVTIVTDSVCHLPGEWREPHDINIVPLAIIFGTEQFLEGVNIGAEAF